MTYLTENSNSLKSLYFLILLLQIEIFVGFYVYHTYTTHKCVISKSDETSSNLDPNDDSSCHNFIRKLLFEQRNKRHKRTSMFQLDLPFGSPMFTPFQDGRLPGRPGAPGPSGLTGPPGVPGVMGPPGPAGLPGNPGPMGHPGVHGVGGQKGDTGLPGPIGLQGAAGFDGKDGSRGSPGEKGEKGNVGEAGVHGVPGINGKHGSPGDKGQKGDIGFVGAPGSKGDAGASGPLGPPGAIGPKGFPGEQGNCNLVCDNLYSRKVEDKLKNYEGYEYPDLTSRNHTCLLTFGTMFQHYSEMSGGAAMQDITAASFEESQKSWIIDSENSRLIEYENPSTSRPKMYDLYMVLEGSAYTIYNGSLFGALGQRKPSIMKYNLNTNSNERLNLNILSVQTLKFLYKSGENYYDIMVDDNGIWAILPIPKSRNTAVLKFDPNSMTIQHIWDVSLHHEKYDKMFIAAGILYTVTVEKNVIRILDGVDLYRNKYYNVNIIIESPQINVKEIQFNAKEFELNLWDDEKRWSSALTCSKFEDFVITIPEE